MSSSSGRRSNPHRAKFLLARRASLLLALLAFGCDGRYVLGSAPNADGGAPHDGQEEGGASASGGAGGVIREGGAADSPGPLVTDGGVGGAFETESSGGARSDGGALDDGGAAGEANVDPGPLERVRWLTVETFSSSSSSQSLLELVDLQKRPWSGVTVESSSTINALPSSDQRWVVYASFRKSATLGDVYDYYVVNTAGKTPGPRQLLLSDQPSWSSCLWSPDASHLACSKQRADVDSDASHLVLFGAAGSSLGLELDVGPLVGTPSFVGTSSIAYTNLEKGLVRFDFGLDAPATPTALGVTCDSFSVSADGQRALCKTSDPESYTLLDVRTADSQLLDLPSGFALSASFEIGISSVADGGDNTHRTYTYYAVNGRQASPAGQIAVQVSPWLPPPVQMARRSVVHADGDRLTFAYVPESGEATARTVPGDYPAVRRYVLDSTGRFLYFSSAELDGGLAITSTIKHWVSRLGPAGAEQPELLAEGFAATTAVFSPDGTRLLLAGNTYNDEDPQPTPIHLITLSETAPALDTLLPLPLNWLTPTFSRDSSYLALIGGSLIDKARELYALDLLAPDASAQLVLSCTSNPAALPGCPNVATF